MPKKLKTPKEIAESGKPFQTTIIVRTQRGLNLMAWCRKNKYELAHVIDELLATYSEDLMGSKGGPIILPKRAYYWPRKHGVSQ